MCILVLSHPYWERKVGEKKLRYGKKTSEIEKRKRKRARKRKRGIKERRKGERALK
jgi:hypothetical protein